MNGQNLSKQAEPPLSFTRWLNGAEVMHWGVESAVEEMV